jgi:glutamate synthase domain-containing protein 2
MSRKLRAEFYTETATEHQETAAVIQRANLARGLWPELALLFHVPNEAKRSRSVAARLKAEGMKSGVPDLILPVARGVYHGLAIEMKRAKGGKLSDNQSEWIQSLRREGWLAVVCEGQDVAWEVIEQYMTSGPFAQVIQVPAHIRLLEIVNELTYELKMLNIEYGKLNIEARETRAKGFATPGYNANTPEGALIREAYDRRDKVGTYRQEVKVRLCETLALAKKLFPEFPWELEVGMPA